MILTDSEVESLKGALNYWEWLGYISTAIVFLGCVGEFVAEFTSLPKTDESRHRLARLSLIVLIFGIAGELLGTVRTSQLSGQIIANIEERSSVNAKEAAQLRKDADALEAQIAPRRLALDQQVKIAGNCARFKNLFAGKRIKVVSYSLDTEAFVLAEQIVGALRACGMSVDDDAMSITPMMSTLVFGISVFGSDSELAKGIANAIGSSGKPVAVSFVGTDPIAGAMRVETPNSLLPHEATILVGLKPYDQDTVNEIKRIMQPTTPVKP